MGQPTAAVISPHLDDAVLSCSGFLHRRPQTVVISVFAGKPQPPMRAYWDLECGFADSDAAIEKRRLEDANALARFDARPIHLNFLDGQYQPQRPAGLEAEISAAILAVLQEYEVDEVLFPLGLHHPDHLLVSETTSAIRGTEEMRFAVYADLPYALAFPGEIDARLGRYDLRTRPPITQSPLPSEAKQRAVSCYTSQVDPLIRDLGSAVESSWSEGAEVHYALSAPFITSAPG